MLTGDSDGHPILQQPHFLWSWHAKQTKNSAVYDDDYGGVDDNNDYDNDGYDYYDIPVFMKGKHFSL